MKKIWAIPDIHGRQDLLMDLLNKLDQEQDLDMKRDEVVFLGDYIDRGPDSKAVVDVVRTWTEMYPGSATALAGNHEWLCIDAHTKGFDDRALWHLNGGYATMNSFGGMLPESYIKWMAALPLSYNTGGFFFSHAPQPTGTDVEKATREALTWNYHPDETLFKDGPEPGNWIGVCGHMHQLRQGVKAPRFYPGYIFADAGCGCHPHAPLVAIEVQSRQVIYAWPVAAQVTCSEEKV